MPHYDVIIIGGGVIGSAIAYHLAAAPAFNGTIAVIERDQTYAQASSSHSTSGIRQQFGTEPNIRMSAHGIEFLRNAPDLLAVDGDPAHIGLREPGYLILGTPDQIPLFEARNAVQARCGVRTDLLTPAEMARRHSWLHVDDLGIGSFGPQKEGWFDGPALHQAFRRKARSLGATYLTDTATALDQDHGRIQAVQTATNGRLEAGTFVLAAGAWSGAVAAMAGIDLPVVPQKRCVFVIDSPHRVPDAPFIMDTSGVILRPEGPLHICGIAPPEENAPDDFGTEIDHDLFEPLIWPALAHRIPAFEQLRMLRAWAGLYEHNSFDHSAIIGRCPDLPNLVFATGFSGHGMMHSPAAGLGVAELITEGQSRTVDLHPFRYERIAANEPIPEHVY